MGRVVFPAERWEELAEEARYDAKTLAKLCGLSTRQLQRHIHRHFERSPQVWLNERRMLVAQRLLLSGEPVKCVAWDLGFKQASHFCRKFKAFHKMTPTEFAASHLSEDSCRCEITNVARG